MKEARGVGASDSQRASISLVQNDPGLSRGGIFAGDIPISQESARFPFGEEACAGSGVDFYEGALVHDLPLAGQ